MIGWTSKRRSAEREGGEQRTRFSFLPLPTHLCTPKPCQQLKNRNEPAPLQATRLSPTQATASMASSSTAPPQQQHQQPAAAPPPPPRNHSITLTHTLLSSYYTHLSPLAALLPPDTVHLDDSDAFKALLDNTVVATTLEHGIENLQVEHMLGQGWSMREVRVNELHVSLTMSRILTRLSSSRPRFSNRSTHASSNITPTRSRNSNKRRARLSVQLPRTYSRSAIVQ